MVLRNPQTRPSLGGLDQTKTKSDQTIPITGVETVWLRWSDIPAIWLVVITSVLTAIPPLLMALIDPDWTYWTAAFLAQVLMPFLIDALFTVGLIVVTETFPEGKQAVAASVFNATSQIGNAMGLAIMQVVTTLVTKKHAGTKPAEEALLQGYKASLWAMFSFMILVLSLGALGSAKPARWDRSRKRKGGVVRWEQAGRLGDVEFGDISIEIY
ncbi:hypothetical protein FOVG_18550 [Fusarium oxysporum f. sp. pisi HDV247]|uniref:Major facilitator superfamily (MFS) profile domain-containing protein n=1 Tax=Fusarium oxysporum f. sp. pisi HDV247 TaxID=1080344 RepID=W9NBG8_FUSOX|nr:hypothetical protein FOVG_18550 [Fusarium oxysporum f. sp. pisi HDV247]